MINIVLFYGCVLSFMVGAFLITIKKFDKALYCMAVAFIVGMVYIGVNLAGWM